MTDKLTTQQVVAAAGVSRVTLFAWVKKGLLPKPDIFTDPCGRGRRAYWHPSTLLLAKDVINIRKVYIPQLEQAALTKARTRAEWVMDNWDSLK